MCLSPFAPIALSTLTITLICLFLGSLRASTNSRKHDHVKELLARAKAKEYQREAHKEKDEIQNLHKHIDKIKKDQDAILNCYIL
jgi:hypothetical protein